MIRGISVGPHDLPGRTPPRLSRRGFLKYTLAASAAVAAPATVRSAAAAAWPSAPVTPLAAPADVFADLAALVVERMAHHRIPGAAVGAILGGEEYAAGFGVTNVDHPLPVDERTLFQIGSITKPYTATALMRLVERGDLDLEAPVRTYLPEFRVADPAASAAVRLVDLVTHTAGWFGDDFAETGDGDEALARYVAGMAALPQIAPVGRYFSYNNAAVNAAGRVVEVVTGVPYETAVRDLVLDPLGLAASFFFPEEIMTRSFAVGHDTSTPTPTVLTPWAIPRASNPAGGIASDVRDLLAFGRFHLVPDGGASARHLLRPETRREMQTRIAPGGCAGFDEFEGVGVSWLLRRVDGIDFVAHDGATNGQASALLLVPERGFALALLTNGSAGGLLAKDLTDWATRDVLRLRPPVIAPVAIAPAELADYAGDFTAGDGIVVRFRAATDHLAAAALLDGDPIPGGTLSLRFAGDDRFLIEENGISQLVDFERADDGAVAWFRFGGRLMPRES